MENGTFQHEMSEMYYYQVYSILAERCQALTFLSAPNWASKKESLPLFMPPGDSIQGLTTFLLVPLL
jgi:hypothetical protein